MNLRYPLFLVLTALIIGVFSTVAYAQSQQETTAADPDADHLMEQIMDSASERGMSVIFVDADSDLSTKRLNGKSDNVQPTNDGTGPSTLMKFQSSSLEFRDKFNERLNSLPESLAIAKENLKQSSPTGELKAYYRVLYWSVLLLMAGALFEHYVYWQLFLNRRKTSRIKAQPTGYREKLPVLLLIAVQRLIGILLSMGFAYLVGSALFPDTPPPEIQFTITLIYIAYAACRVTGVLWRSILAPNLTQYRIPYFSDFDARRLFHWLWFTASFNICAILFNNWMESLANNSDLDAFFTSLVGGMVALLNTLLVVVNRKAISLAIRNGKTTTQASGLSRVLSIIWFPVITIYFIFSWLHMTWLLVLEKGLVTPLIAGAYGILVAVLLVYALVNYAIEWAFHRKRSLALLNATGPDVRDTGDDSQHSHFSEPQPNEVQPPHTLRSYEDLARRVAGLLAGMAGLWSLTKIWNLREFMRYDAFLTQSGDLIFILFVGYIIYHSVRIWIDNKIIEEGGDDTAIAPGDEGGAAGASRLATLLPLFRNFMLIVIAISVLFSAFMELGINLGPLFASAGVVGLAIGFGAQTLVRDIFSGAFYLFDDAFRKGEYVDIGNVKGTVEKISVRSFQLRHHLGPLHTIPFGEIQFLTNYSRDWVMMKLPLRLTYDTDIEQVRKLIKKLGLQLLEDPEIGHTFLQPLKSQGVLEMQDSAMIVRVKFMTKPGDQWNVRKRVYHEIRELFEREGIRFAHREVTVRIAAEETGKLTEVEKQALGAAALSGELDEQITPDSGDDR